MQSSGTDFEQTLFFSEKKWQLRKFWMSWKNCLARVQWMTSLFLPMSIRRCWNLLLIGWQIEGWMDRMIEKIPGKLETFVLQVTVTIGHLSLSERKKKANKQTNKHVLFWVNKNKIRFKCLCWRFFLLLSSRQSLEIIFISEGTVTNPANWLALSATEFSFLCPRAPFLRWHFS